MSDRDVNIASLLFFAALIFLLLAAMASVQHHPTLAWVGLAVVVASAAGGCWWAIRSGARRRRDWPLWKPEAVMIYDGGQRILAEGPCPMGWKVRQQVRVVLPGGFAVKMQVVSTTADMRTGTFECQAQDVESLLVLQRLPLAQWG